MNGPIRVNLGRDLLPLSQRVTALMVLRTVLAAAMVGSAALLGEGPGSTVVVITVGYLVATAALSASALLVDRRWAVRAFGGALLLDGVFLQYMHERSLHGTASDVAIAMQLMAVCLLASFRSGLKMAAWQTILMLGALRAEESGLFPGVDHLLASGREDELVVDCLFLWLATVLASAAGAMNERELRRRRYDAEVLQRFATQLHGDKRSDQAVERLCRFAIEELQASRVLVCDRGAGGWTLISGQGLSPAPDGVGSASALLDLPLGPEGEVLALRLDPTRDPWLSAVLPDARRVIALKLPAAHDVSRWLVLEHGVRRSSRVEQRIISTVAQAAAATALALARAQLLEQAERAASVDALTGLANRRTFDTRLADLTDAHRRRGTAFALVLVDVDKFKSINDRFGHPAGDAVLQRVARTIAEGSRPGDLPARYGGEEFAVLLPRADREQARVVAERIRIALHRVGGPTPVTASFGVAVLPDDASDPDELVELADQALLAAKEGGRDRVVCAAGERVNG